MGKEYCYRVKSNYIYVNEKNAYKRPLIENYGFAPMQEEFEDETGKKTYSWAGGWAKSITMPYNCSIAKWVRKNVETIYNKEKDKEDSKWRKEILDAGYEFDEEGKLIENDTYKANLTGQLCILHEGELSGVLFINLGESVEFYDSEALIGAAFEEIMQLIKADVVYKKRLFVEKKKNKKHDRKKYN